MGKSVVVIWLRHLIKWINYLRNDGSEFARIPNDSLLVESECKKGWVLGGWLESCPMGVYRLFLAAFIARRRQKLVLERWSSASTSATATSSVSWIAPKVASIPASKGATPLGSVTFDSLLPAGKAKTIVLLSKKLKFWLILYPYC